jgi:hypothetical protein
MLRSIAVALLALTFASPVSAADGVGALRTYCMDNWAGEVCFDITTFQIADARVTIGGNWYGPGYPAGYRTPNGSGPSAAIHIWDYMTAGFDIDPDTQSGSRWLWQDVWVGEIYDPITDEIVEDIYRPITSLDDIGGLSFSARVGPDGALESAECATAAWQRPGVQTCRVVSVPEPRSLLLVASGVFGLAYVRRRRAA